MPEILVAIVVILALLGLYMLAWQRHSRRHTTGHWYRYRLRPFDTLGDGRQRGSYSEHADDADAGSGRDHGTGGGRNHRTEDG